MNNAPYFMNPVNYTPYQSNIYGQQMQAGQLPNQAYGQPMQMQQNQMVQQRVDFQGAFINNFDEVKNYAVPIGSAVMLMDKENNKFYLKMIDNNGNPLINTFRFEDATQQPQQTQQAQQQSANGLTEQTSTDYVQLKNRLEALENKVMSYEHIFGALQPDTTQNQTQNNVKGAK